jgi:hypothetical protein
MLNWSNGGDLLHRREQTGEPIRPGTPSDIRLLARQLRKPQP